MVDVVRTPEERFAALPDWPYRPHYVDWEGIRLARVDEGPSDGDPIVLLHGEPTWGYLYRRLLPPLLGTGARVVVVDHPGFGRSDKPTDRGWYTYPRLVESLDAHLAAADVRRPVTLVVHDWGGPIGLRWATQHPDRVARLVILDTGLYAPGGAPSAAWTSFRDFVATAETLPVGRLVQGGAATELSEEVVAAYDAPFHTPSAQAGALALPLLVPTSADDPGAAQMWAANQALDSWEHPTLILWGEDDAILTPRIGRRWEQQIPGCVGMETFTPAGHFLQEDQGLVLGQRIARFVATGR